MESFLFIELFEKSGAQLGNETYMMIPDNVFQDLYPVLKTNQSEMLQYPELRNIIENYIISRKTNNTITTKSGETFNIRMDNRGQITEIDDVPIISYDSENDKYYIDGLLFSERQLDAFNAWKSKSKGASLSRVRAKQGPTGVRARPTVLGPKPGEKRRTSPPRPPVGVQIEPRRSNDTGSQHLAAIKSLPLNPASPRDISMVGWDSVKPESIPDRNALKDKCGSGCFLRPGDNKFPICARLDTTNNQCGVDCRGLAAAKNRARYLQTKDPRTSTPYNKETIDDLQKHFGCRKETGEAAQPRPRQPVKPVPVEIKSTAAQAPSISGDEGEFQIGDVVYSTILGSGLIHFGVVTRITPTGKLRIEFLEKRIGRVLHNDPDYYQAEVFPTNIKTGKSILTTAKGVNDKQRMSFMKYHDNLKLYDEAYM